MVTTALATAVATLVVVGGLAWLGRHAVRVGLADRTEIDEEHLRELFESSDEAGALVDRDGRLVRVNDAFYQLFGFTSREVDGLRLEKILPSSKGDGAEPAEAVARAAAGRSTTLEAVARKADGAAVEVSVAVGPARVRSEPAVAFVMFRDDIRKVLVETAFRRLEKALDTMQLGVTVTDLDGRIVYTNPADARMHGWTPEELVGRDVRVLGPDDLAERLTPSEIESMGTWSRESVNVRRDGTTFPVQLMSDVVRDVDGHPIGVVTTCEDITQRRQAERALRESEERYALALRGAADGIWDWNLPSDEVFYSSLWREMVGVEDGPADGSIEAWLARVHPEDREGLEAALTDLREDRTGRISHEHRIQRADGSWMWALARGTVEHDPEGRPYRITGSLTDITEQKEQEARLVQDALYDPLTGLPNRAFLRDLLQRAMARLARDPEHEFAVLFLDLDRFKQVNDTLGHAAGDALLKEVADRLQASVRPDDVVTRLAGDEFCVLLDEIEETADATRVARRIIERLGEPVELDGREVLTGCSIGIAVSEPDMTDPDRIVENADAARYRAKREGRDRFELFDRSMQEQVIESLRLENELREAVELRQFQLVYQPVVRLDNRKVTGLEALVRWHHPERGVMPPGSFVPTAEETGVIVPLGWWVLDEACSQMAAWSERHPESSSISVSVNLSARQLRDPELVGRVEAAVESSGLDPRRLRLEVSESTLMDDPEWNEAVLGQLAELGVEVHVDDFGTGSWSLACLERFKVSSLKIDPSVVRSMADRDTRGAVMEAFITLARHLDIQVVAEGVESADDDARLQDVRCDLGQGFLYHAPLEPADVDDLFGRLPGAEA